MLMTRKILISSLCLTSVTIRYPIMEKEESYKEVFLFLVPEIIETEYDYENNNSGKNEYHVETDKYITGGSNEWDSANRYNGSSLVNIDTEKGTSNGTSQDQAHSEYNDEHKQYYKDANRDSKSSGVSKSDYDRYDTSSFEYSPDESSYNNDGASKSHYENDNEYSITDKRYGKTVGSSFDDSDGHSLNSYKFHDDKDATDTAWANHDHTKNKAGNEYTHTDNDGTVTTGSGTSQSEYVRNDVGSTHEDKNGTSVSEDNSCSHGEYADTHESVSGNTRRKSSSQSTSNSKGSYKSKRVGRKFLIITNLII